MQQRIMSTDEPLHPQVVPIIFLVGPTQASPVAQGREEVLALGQAI